MSLAVAASVECCCDGPCVDPDPCKVFSTQVCVLGDSEGCTPPPTISITVGPGSTAIASCRAQVVNQDVRIYGIGSGYSAVDPGAFPDDPDHDECTWTHEYEPEANEWLRGRKICKTVASFADVQFTWQLNRRTCAWAFVALNVPVRIGVASAIVETGTPEVGGTRHLRIESHADEEIECDIYLSLDSELVWCPDTPDDTNTITLTLRRSDGTAFPRLWHEDWEVEDALMDPPTDTLAFPDIAGTPGSDPSDYNWPRAPMAVEYSTDRTELVIGMALPPTGAFRSLASEGTWEFIGDDAHNGISGADEYIGYAICDGWTRTAGAIVVKPSNEDCEDPAGSCAECTTIASANTIGSTGIPWACAWLTWDELIESDQFLEQFCWSPSADGSASQIIYSRQVDSTYRRWRLVPVCCDVGGTPTYKLVIDYYERVLNRTIYSDGPPDEITSESETTEAASCAGDAVTLVPFQTSGADCTVGWAVDSDWSLDGTDCSLAETGCCDEFIVCFFGDGVGSYVPGYTRTACPGIATSGSYSQLGDCKGCPTAPAQDWIIATTYDPTCLFTNETCSGPWTALPAGGYIGSFGGCVGGCDTAKTGPVDSQVTRRRIR